MSKLHELAFIDHADTAIRLYAGFLRHVEERRSLLLKKLVNERASSRLEAPALVEIKDRWLRICKGSPTLAKAAGLDALPHSILAVAASKGERGRQLAKIARQGRLEAPRLGFNACTQFRNFRRHVDLNDTPVLTRALCVPNERGAMRAILTVARLPSLDLEPIWKAIDRGCGSLVNEAKKRRDNSPWHHHR